MAYIEKIRIINYKKFKDSTIKFKEETNIIVGNNEEGKSTILESIYLVCNGQINNRPIQYELSPYLFNQETANDFVSRINNGEVALPPEIIIELYLNECDETAKLRGSINMDKTDANGVFLKISLSEDYYEEYKEYISSKNISTIPIEFYEAKLFSFANKILTSKAIPINSAIIDTTSQSFYNYPNRQMVKIIKDYLDKKQQANLALNYRKLKELFIDNPSISEINKYIEENTRSVSERELLLSIDISSKNNWESIMTTYIDNIPFDNIGLGEQNSMKTKIAINKKSNCDTILIEEPENHLSYSNMEKLISEIIQNSSDKQLIMTTHSPYVANKLGLDNLILINNSEVTYFNDLENDTKEFFEKIPGYDTLRLLLNKKVILVEGDSDELIVQKAYLQKNKKLPIEDAIDIISVGTSFKRFLEIACKVNKEVIVLTDNDSDIDALNKKYKEYLGKDLIHLFWDYDTDYETLEPQLIKSNGLEKIQRILETSFQNEQDLRNYMKKNKTKCALTLFKSEEEIDIPEYINKAIEEVSKI